MTTNNDRDSLKKYIKGIGIEIGALQNPLNLQDLKIKEVQYVDKFSSNELITHYPKLKGMPLVDPDIVDDAQTLEKIIPLFLIS